MKMIKEILARIRGEYTTVKLKKMGLKVGRNFSRQGGVILDPSHCWLIEIGDDVTLAPRVHILCHDASTKHGLGYTKIGRVTIGNNVFIGAETVVLPNVTIGNNIVVGANSTITRDIPDNSVVAGNPAKVVCSYDEFLEKNKKRMEETALYGREYTLGGGITEERKTKQKEELGGGKWGGVV